ncbi:MAG: DnaB helicase C-terminal domain-containing protein [Gemmatimonadota bacterium]|nr:DnaB helicase C-terminal domain-containing protein [Gemmatimonadota bacterium]MDH4347421.1 DnaB helicase C-terminal domain-containing protein [Gemmatimonadota bacterium]MDH5282884.1 DnaB helicase C-terminal domain-containing protein [Gemmatimonadota bacterium]
MMRRPRSPDRPSSAAEALVARIDARSSTGAPGDGIRTGFPSIDQMLGGGPRRQDLVVLSGDVGSGKSSLALAIAVRAAGLGAQVTYLSGEMSEERLMERALAQESRVSVEDLRGGRLDDFTRAAVGAAALRLRDIPLQVRNLPGEQFEEVSRALETVPRQELLIIDDLQMTASPVIADSADERVAATTRALKALAVERDVAILVLAQLPRFRTGRREPRPTLDDLGGQGVVKQVADVVLSVYREEMYRPGGGMEGAVELIIAKNRNGSTGHADLFFYRNWLRFEDLLDPDR